MRKGSYIVRFAGLASVLAWVFSGTSCERPKTEKFADINKISGSINEYFQKRTTSLEMSMDLPDEYTAEIPTEISKDKVAYFRNEIWKLWQDANAPYIQQSLPELKALSEKVKGSWQLPADMEPNATMPFYFGTKGERPADGYPLYIYMHGSGPKATEWSTGYTLCSRFEDSVSLYFIPQIPNEGNYYRWWHRSKQFAWERLMRLSVAAGYVNPDKIYMFGISEGGYGSQRLASFYGDYLAAAGPMAGGEPLANAPAENCGNIGFSLRTGDQDNGFYRNTLTQYTADKFAELKSQNPGEYENWIELISGKGHAIDYYPTVPWLEKFTRKASPSHFIWENYDMHDRYRDCFHNLVINGRTAADGRRQYEFSIKDNVIDITVSDVEYICTETDPMWGIQMKFDRKLTPSEKWDMTIFLDDTMADLDRDITVKVNGKESFKGKVSRSAEDIVYSCAVFFDPHRLYPASIRISDK